MTQPFVLKRPCGDAVPQVVEALADNGLVVTQSFDLRVATSPFVRVAELVGQEHFRTLLTIPDDCVCPKHGTAGCDCQMVVMLVYGKATAPATLVANGHDGHTWLSLANAPEQRTDPALAAMITQVLHGLCWATPSKDAGLSQEVRL